MMRFALSLFVLTLLAPQAGALGASYQDVKGPKDKAEKKQDKPEKEKGQNCPCPRARNDHTPCRGGWCGYGPQGLEEPTALRDSPSCRWLKTGGMLPLSNHGYGSLL